jgi:hypothetical protein
MQPTFGWRLPSFYRFQVVGTLGVFAVVGMLLLTTSTFPAPAGFALLWIAIVCWNGYWFLLRIVYQLEVAGGVLWWRAPLRSGQVPITEVVAVRPSRVAVTGHVVATRRGTILVAFATPGFAEFAAALRAVQPTVSVRVGRLAQPAVPRRWLEGAGFYRHD